MAKSKPLMTPEQQKMFKQAVAAKAIPHMDYEDYCKITPKEAEKMLKAVEGKVDFKSPEKPDPEAPEAPEAPEKEPERKAPVIKDPDSPATKFQKRALSEAVKAGHMEALPEDQWKALTKGEASKIIAELHAKEPPVPGGKSRRMKIIKTAKTSAAIGDAENEKTEIPGRYQSEKHHCERAGSQVDCPTDCRQN